MINNSKIILNFTIIYKHHQNKLNLHFLLTIWNSVPAPSTFVLVQFLLFIQYSPIFCINYFKLLFFYLGTWCYVFYFYTGTNKFGWIWRFLLLLSYCFLFCIITVVLVPATFFSYISSLIELHLIPDRVCFILDRVTSHHWLSLFYPW